MIKCNILKVRMGSDRGSERFRYVRGFHTTRVLQLCIIVSEQNEAFLTKLITYSVQFISKTDTT